MIKESIATQLMRVVFICYCLVALLVTIVHMVQEYRYTQQAISSELESFQEIFTPVLSKAMWDLDRARIGDILQAIHDVPIIVGVKVNRKDDEYKIFMATGKVFNDQGDLILYDQGRAHASVSFSEEFYQSRFPVEYEYAGAKRLLGYASFYSSSSIVFERVRVGFIFLAVNALIKGVALWLIFYWFSQRIILTPLNSFIEKIKTFDYRKLDEINFKNPSTKRNEIEDLHLSFSDMIYKVKAYRDESIQARKILDEKVAMRTQDLVLEKYRIQHSLQVKSDFMTSMSREIRAAMDGLMACLDKSDKNLTQIKLAKSKAKSMMLLMSDLLEIKELAAFNIKVGEFNVNHEINSVLAVMAPIFEQKGLELMVNLKGVGDDILIADDAKFRWILHVLLSNAYMFTVSGGVSIQAELMKPGQLKMSIGMSEDKIAALNQSISLGAPNTTGTELSMVKRLCELMGGKIEFVSELGKGSQITFTLPVFRSQAGP